MFMSDKLWFGNSGHREVYLRPMPEKGELGEVWIYNLLPPNTEEYKSMLLFNNSYTQYIDCKQRMIEAFGSGTDSWFWSLSDSGDAAIFLTTDEQITMISLWGYINENH